MEAIPYLVVTDCNCELSTSLVVWESYHERCVVFAFIFKFGCGCFRFAGEIFHDLHEEVMVTAARGHELMVRVQQLEVEFPSIEMAFLSQTNHSSLFTSTGL